MKENILVNQAIAKRTAHPPLFETGQMCSLICIPLIFKRLKKRVHPEVNSLKRLHGACSESERPLLLRKEWGNAGETRLLPKECWIDFRRKWLTGACNKGECPLLFGRSGEMPEKHDSFQRSVGQIYGENGSLVPVSRVNVPYSFGRSGEMTGKRDSFGRSAG